MYCQLTLGNRKKTDLLVESKDQLFRVSVKAKQKQSWPRVKGIWQPGDLLVFVDYKSKVVPMPPDFYVLDVSAWKKVVKRIKRRKNDPRATIDKENTLCWEDWIGCQVSRADVAEFKDAWPAADPPEDLNSA
jgi:hypothetical protein